MAKEDTKGAGLIGQIESEIRQFLTEQVYANNDNSYTFSQYNITNRIALFDTQTYPTGKFDTQGNYKYWFDIISPRIENEVKNIDFDTKNIEAYSPAKMDEVPMIILNLKIEEYLKVTGQAEEINSAIEEGAGWGNVVWKKIKKTYERVDISNFYVINQTAFSLDETPVIERHQFTASDLRAKMNVWENVKEVIEQMSEKTYKTKIGTQESNTTVPYYDIYERNGEVSVFDLKTYKEETPLEDDKNKFVLARVIAAGVKGNTSGVTIEYIMFAEELKGKKMSDIYKEYHRSRYAGRWWRKGIYELLFDLQVRANQIGNQLAQGLELASKTVLASEDKLVVQNILTDMRNGDIITAKNLTQVILRMDSFDQLVADWNRVISLANDLTNSQEVVTGITPASGTPLGTTKLLNENAGKLYVFIRQKITLPYTFIFEEWLIPDLMKELSAEEVLRLTGDSEMLGRLYKIIVDNWYVNNLVFMQPHTKEIGDALKAEKMEELISRPQLLVKATKEMFKGVKPRVSIIITGEQIGLPAELQSLAEFIALESDPIRRTAMIEMAMRKKGIDTGALPKTEAGLQTVQPGQPTPAAV